MYTKFTIDCHRKFLSIISSKLALNISPQRRLSLYLSSRWPFCNKERAIRRVKGRENKKKILTRLVYKQKVGLF